MVGIVVIAHGNLAKAFVETAEEIVGGLERVVWVCVKERHRGEEIRKEIEKAIKKVDMGYGVLLLTDMFGGTPSNLGLTFLEKGRVEVLTGLNLPMLLKLATCREGKNVSEVAECLKEYGKESISIASEILEGGRWLR